MSAGLGRVGTALGRWLVHGRATRADMRRDRRGPPGRPRRAPRGRRRRGEIVTSRRAALPGSRRALLLPLLRAARRRSSPAPRAASSSRSSTTATATASSACSTRRTDRGAALRRPLQGRRRSAGPATPPGLFRFRRGALRAARLRRRPHPEPRGLVPPRVPRATAGDAGPVSLEALSRTPAASPRWRPLPELRKLPGRFYPINYLFIEITNACNFKCTWCPDDDHGAPARLHEEGEGLPHPRRDRGRSGRGSGPSTRSSCTRWASPCCTPTSCEIVAYAETRGVPIELNTNCGLITEERIEGLYRAGLTNLILSYQTPDSASFKTRKAPRLAFDEYRDKVRLAVERKVALGAPHAPRDRHHEHEVRRRLADRERGRAGAGLPRGLDRLRPGAGATLRPRPARHDSSASAASTSSTRTRTAAATSCSTASPHLEALPLWGNVIETSGSEQQQADGPGRPSMLPRSRGKPTARRPTTSSSSSGTATW